MTPADLIVIVLGYGLGSIPVGYLLVRLRTGQDLRRAGSGSTGATNVARLLGRPGFAAVFLLDLGKGWAAVALASVVTDHPWAMSGAGVAAVAGHLWPVSLRFRGGKGLATGYGACLALSPLVGGVALVALVALLLILRPSMLALTVVLVAIPIGALVSDPDSAMGLLLMAVLVLFGHRTNILALLPGGTDHGRVRVMGRPTSSTADARSRR